MGKDKFSDDNLDYELEIMLRKSREDVRNGNYTEDSVDEHINRIVE